MPHIRFDEDAGPCPDVRSVWVLLALDGGADSSLEDCQPLQKRKEAKAKRRLQHENISIDAVNVPAHSAANSSGEPLRSATAVDERCTSLHGKISADGVVANGESSLQHEDRSVTHEANQQLERKHKKKRKREQEACEEGGCHQENDSVAQKQHERKSKKERKHKKHKHDKGQAENDRDGHRKHEEKAKKERKHKRQKHEQDQADEDDLGHPDDEGRGQGAARPMASKLERKRKRQHYKQDQQQADEGAGSQQGDDDGRQPHKKHKQKKHKHSLGETDGGSAGAQHNDQVSNKPPKHADAANKPKHHHHKHGHEQKQEEKAVGHHSDRGAKRERKKERKKRRQAAADEEADRRCAQPNPQGATAAAAQQALAGAPAPAQAAAASTTALQAAQQASAIVQPAAAPPAAAPAGSAGGPQPGVHTGTSDPRPWTEQELDDLVKLVEEYEARGQKVDWRAISVKLGHVSSENKAGKTYEPVRRKYYSIMVGTPRQQKTILPHKRSMCCHPLTFTP